MYLQAVKDFQASATFVPISPVQDGNGSVRKYVSALVAFV
jgi:hypothetical protein